MGQNLAEDLLAYLEMSLAVEVLEKALCIESVSAYDLFKCLYAKLDGFAVFEGGLLARVDGLGPHIFYFDCQVLLQALLSKDLINSINKVTPADMLAFLWSFEFGSQQFKFLARNLNFGHIQPDSKLALRDEP